MMKANVDAAPVGPEQASGEEDLAQAAGRRPSGRSPRPGARASTRTHAPDRGGQGFIASGSGAGGEEQRISVVEPVQPRLVHASMGTGLEYQPAAWRVEEGVAQMSRNLATGKAPREGAWPAHARDAPSRRCRGTSGRRAATRAPSPQMRRYAASAHKAEVWRASRSGGCVARRALAALGCGRLGPTYLPRHPAASRPRRARTRHARATDGSEVRLLARDREERRDARASL